MRLPAVTRGKDRVLRQAVSVLSSARCFALLSLHVTPRGLLNFAWPRILGANWHSRAPLLWFPLTCLYCRRRGCASSTGFWEKKLRQWCCETCIRCEGAGLDSFLVNLTQTRAIGKEEISVEKGPPLDCPIDKSLGPWGCFLD